MNAKSLVSLLCSALLLATLSLQARERAGGGGRSASGATKSHHPSSGKAGFQAPGGKAADGARAKPALPENQQANLDKLKADLESMKGKSEVTPEQKTALKNDLKSTLQGAQKPSAESVDKLAEDLAAGTADGKLGTKEILAIRKDVNAVLNSAAITDAQTQQLQTDVQNILKASNLTQQDAATLTADVKAVADTARQNAAQRK